MKSLLIALAVVSAGAIADPGVKVVATGQLPTCFQSVQFRELYPRMKIKNACPFPTEVVWCWKAVPKGWVNESNTCANTGFLSSGLIEPNATYEFPDRPYLDSEFKPSAMLTVHKVCSVGSSQAGLCK